MRIQRSIAVLALLSGLGATSVHAQARAVEWLASPAGDVRAGESVELRWAVPPADVEELEILLSVDGGRTFPIRVSPELEAREGRWLWRVPNLAAKQACLRLRLGNQEGETLGETSACFRIVARASGASSSDLVHEGPWWNGAESELASRAVPGLTSSEPVISRADGESAVGPPPREVALKADAMRTGPLATAAQESPRHSSPPPATPRRLIPLRE